MSDIMTKIKSKLTYEELREEIHEILMDFLRYEMLMDKNGEFDFEYMEYRTDEILRLIKRQGGIYADMKTCKDCEHFLGFGDWSLCCTETSGLCYEYTPACKRFKRRAK